MTSPAARIGAVLTSILLVVLGEEQAGALPLERVVNKGRSMTIGRSVEDRPIRAVGFGDPTSRHSVLVVGCIHGNECAGKRIVRKLRKKRHPQDLYVWTISSLNPDGARAHTRQNARGVDLNRNFERKWRPIGEPWDTYYSGPRRWSEPETRIARSFIRKRRPDVTIWYHQQMSLVVKTGRHQRIKARYARLVGLPLVRLDPLPGTAPRWQNHRFPRHAAFVVELPGGRVGRREAWIHARAVREVGRM